MSQKFKFNILTGDNAPEKYAAITTKDPFTFYLLQTGQGYLGTVKLFGSENSSDSSSTVMSGNYFRAVSSHVITQDDLNNTNISIPEGVEIGTVGMLFTSDSDQEDNGNEIYYFIPIQFTKEEAEIKIETVDEINEDNPGDKIPTETAIVNYIAKVLADKISFEIDNVSDVNLAGTGSGFKETDAVSLKTSFEQSKIYQYGEF